MLTTTLLIVLWTSLLGVTDAKPSVTYTEVERAVMDVLKGDYRSLTSLTLRELWERVPNMSWADFLKGTRIAEDEYDLIFDVSSMHALLEGKAWDITWLTPEKVFVERASRPGHELSATVAIKGAYNRGKSFLLGLLSKKKFMSDDTRRTRGVSVKYVDDSDMVLVDTAGTNVPTLYTADAIRDRLATDAFLQDLTYAISDINLIVVGQLRLDDQQYIEALHSKLVEDALRSTGGRREDAVRQIREKCFIVHNYRSLSTVEQMEAVIQHDMAYFGAQKAERFGAVLYESKAFLHIFFGEHEKPSGQRYNEQSVRLLKMLLQGKVNLQRTADIAERLRRTATRLLQDYIEVDLPPPTDTPAPGSLLESTMMFVKRLMPGRTTVTPQLGVDIELKEVKDDAASEEGRRHFTVYSLNTTGPLPPLRLSRYIHFTGGVSHIRADGYYPEASVTTLGGGVVRLRISVSDVAHLQCKVMRRHRNVVLVRGTRPSPAADGATTLDTFRYGPFELHIELPIYLDPQHEADLNAKCAGKTSGTIEWTFVDVEERTDL